MTIPRELGAPQPDYDDVDIFTLKVVHGGELIQFDKDGLQWEYRCEDAKVLQVVYSYPPSKQKIIELYVKSQPQEAAKEDNIVDEEENDYPEDLNIQVNNEEDGAEANEGESENMSNKAKGEQGKDKKNGPKSPKGKGKQVNDYGDVEDNDSDADYEEVFKDSMYEQNEKDDIILEDEKDEEVFEGYVDHVEGDNAENLEAHKEFGEEGPVDPRISTSSNSSESEADIVGVKRTRPYPSGETLYHMWK
ncbi:hypothetical protein ACFX19_023149 [Malus domestica]